MRSWVTRRCSGSPASTRPPDLGQGRRRPRQNPTVRRGFDLLDSSAPVLIIGGRYVPGMRFVVNATMGLSDIRYRRFLPWSVDQRHPVEHLHLRARLRDRAGAGRLPVGLVHHLGPGDHRGPGRGHLHRPTASAERRRAGPSTWPSPTIAGKITGRRAARSRRPPGASGHPASGRRPGCAS